MTIKEILPGDVQKKLEQEETLYIIDVREDEEVAQGMISEAVHLPLGEIPNKLELFDQDTEYVFVCRSGARSLHACQYLDSLGYKVTNMVGGMLDWDGPVKPKE